MSVKSWRSSFHVSLVGPKEITESLQSTLAGAGYNVNGFASHEDLKKGVENSPPHFIVWSQKSIDPKAIVQQLKAYKIQLPETRILWLGDASYISKIYESLADGFYDILSWPLSHENQLVKSLDRGIENLVRLYEREEVVGQVMGLQKTIEDLNLAIEEKEAAIQEAEAAVLPSVEQLDPFSEYAHFQHRLFQQLSRGSSVDVFVKSVTEAMAAVNGQGVYFRYLAPRKTLVATFPANITSEKVHGVGLNFEILDPNFRKSDIHTVESHKEFTGLIQEVFQQNSCHVLKLNVLGEIVGVFVFWGLEEGSDVYHFIENAFHLLEKNCVSVELEKRLHTNRIIDEQTEAFNKHHFLKKISEEISRARRTLLPVSLLLISIDSLDEIESQCREEDVALFLKSLVRILIKHSRVNDIVGRISHDEFAVLLPHTSRRGGAIKAERIRRMIETADFSRIISAPQGVTISLGVSEYPSICKDADEIFETADRALYKIKGDGGNKVMMAQAPNGFVADFVVNMGTN